MWFFLFLTSFLLFWIERIIFSYAVIEGIIVIVIIVIIFLLLTLLLMLLLSLLLFVGFFIRIVNVNNFRVFATEIVCGVLIVDIVITIIIVVIYLLLGLLLILLLWLNRECWEPFVRKEFLTRIFEGQYCYIASLQ